MSKFNLFLGILLFNSPNVLCDRVSILFDRGGEFHLAKNFISPSRDLFKVCGDFESFNELTNWTNKLGDKDFSDGGVVKLSQNLVESEGCFFFNDAKSVRK